MYTFLIKRRGVPWMNYIALGCLAFLFLYIFDINKIFVFHKGLNVFFAVGILLLAGATAGLLAQGERDWYLSAVLHNAFWFFSLVFFLLLMFALFFALPFSRTYVKLERNNLVVDTGMYALSRHPGVLWFFLMYVSLWLASGKTLLLWAAVIWTIMDVIHVYVQDRWIFPRTLQNYRNYQNTTPFLLPDFPGIIKYLQTFSRRGNDDTGAKVKEKTI